MATTHGWRFRGVAIQALLLAWFATLPVTGHAASFVVDNPADFQTALTTAQGNGESDVITVQPNLYPVSSTLTYSSGEPWSLTITGAGPGLTILDGGTTTQVLRLVATAAGAALVVQGLTIRYGLAAGETGGGLHLETGSGSLAVANCEVNDCSVTGASGIGGGASVVSASGAVDISGSFFRRNTSAANVGGLYAATTANIVSVSDCVFEDNTVDNTGGDPFWGDGGGAELYTEQGGQVTVTGCTFTGNIATGGNNSDGGGLMTYQLGNGATAEVASSTFSGNQAGLGGAGLIMRINASGTMTCTGNTFNGNTAGVGSGGGALLYLDSGTLNATGNTCDSNDTAEDGGGIWISLGSGTATVTGNTFVGNQAGNNGGGLVLATDLAASTVARNVFRANTAGNVGAGLSYATTNGSLGFTASTFYGNTATGDGGGVYIYIDQETAPLAVTDLILWNDQPNELGFSSGTGGGSVVVRYSDAQASSGEPWFGEGSIDADPLFVDAGSGDLHLSWENYPVPDSTMSPCIDSGDPASPLDPDGTRADMGALPFDQGELIFGDGFESGDTSAWSATVP